MKKIFFFIGWISNYLFPSRIKTLVKAVLAIYNSGRISKSLKDVGENVFIYKQFTLAGGDYISLGNNVSLGARGTLTAWNKYGNDRFFPEIIIEDNVTIGEGFHITAINKIHIKSGVLVGKYLTVSDNSHGKAEFDDLKIMPSKRSLFSKGPVVIEENVWIGDKVTILPNVNIGKNAIIGANSVVTKNIESNCVVAGNPAKVIKILSIQQ